MTIHRIKIYDKDMNLKEIITEEEASAHFYRDSAPSKTVRKYIDGVRRIDKKCEFCGADFVTNLHYARFCKDIECRRKRDRQFRAENYQKEKVC